MPRSGCAGRERYARYGIRKPHTKDAARSAWRSGVAGLLHARPIACGFGSLEEQASLPTRAGLAGGRVIHLLEHSWYAQQIGRFEGTQIGQQRLCVRQITNHAVVGSNRRVLDEPCETVGERQEEKQSRMIFENDLMQRQTACARDRYEIAVRKLGTLWSSRRTGRVHDGGRSSACTESMRASSSSSDTVTPKPSNAPMALESSIRMCLRDGQRSITESRRSKRSRLSAMASFTSESLRIRSACAAESVS